MIRRKPKKLIKKLKELNDQQQSEPSLDLSLYEQVVNELEGCSDSEDVFFPEHHVHFVFFNHLVDTDRFKAEILDPFYHVHKEELDSLLNRSFYKPVTELKKIIEGVLDGQVAIFNQERVFLVNVAGPEKRNIQPSETETTITGPHEGFIESGETNLSMIRRRVKTSRLKVNKLPVGEVTKTNAYLLYIKGIANEELVSELTDRIERIEIDAVYDAHMLSQLIEDQPNSLFPQFIARERPDSIAAGLVEGKIIILLEGSPAVIIAPSSFFDFFETGDDYYQRWLTGTATRLLRFGAFIITIAFTALYVSVTSYHYEMIPESLLTTLAVSRGKVPFDPIYEALLMEITIEFLREAGARLPTKVGQTIGIVGGIVIGQAAVQAGITSNVLIIVVAISAIASFVVPSYIMSASIRLARFGLILLAGLLGNLGIVIGLTIIVIHLSSLTSVGAPYLAPLSPFFPSDWKDFLLRAPYKMMKSRPTISRSPKKRKLKE
ncbi:spore germination protein [Pseudalkalibacillus hwajinpoensis]|uniref:Spore germination protein n=1 Tax=Guptibacillus hwajinpoensis TaxID=208199 RepID=A0A4U1MLE4_9BACL|nr:spore germination protein [Pseudalkalibacillus hwajinpoensis]TKD72013.1 spore germination protein [Pseudalkalibacillus hwajinpoensis]